MVLSEVLRDGDIVPDLIDQAAPETHHVNDVRIEWHAATTATGGSGEKVAAVDKPGAVLTPRQTHDAPRMTFSVQKGVDSSGRELRHGKYHTVVKTDPDAPSRADPKFREYLHWIRANCPVQRREHAGGAGGSFVDVSGTGEEVAAYVGAGPPRGTGLHRYVFLVYAHASPIAFAERWARSAADRPKFCVRDFAARYGLGDPVGVTYYQAEYDEWSDKIFRLMR